MVLKPDNILGGRWKIGNLLGEGAHGKVYTVSAANPDVKQFQGDLELVVKCIPYGKNLPKKKAKEQEKISNTLNMERDLLAPGQLLQTFKYRPKVPMKYYYGKDENEGVLYLVMENIKGGTLGQLATKNPLPTPFSIATIGLQILDGLIWLHSKGWLFIDIKPENFMLRGEEIVFIDYGLAERYLTSKGHRENISTDFAGTTSYISLSVHQGSLASRRDELESLCYVMIALASENKLPWSNGKSIKECCDIKETCDIQALCTNCGCFELTEIIRISRACAYEQTPDYERVRAILTSMKNRVEAPTMPMMKQKQGKRKISSSDSLISDPNPMVKESLKQATTSSKSVTSVVDRIATTSKEKGNVVQEQEKAAPPTKKVIIRRTNAVSSPPPVQSPPPATRSGVAGVQSPSAPFSLLLRVTAGPHSGDCFMIRSTDALPGSNGHIERLLGGLLDSHLLLDGDAAAINSQCALLWLRRPDGRLDVCLQERGAAGSTLNGRPLRRKRWSAVQAGDVIGIGGSEVRLELSK